MNYQSKYLKYKNKYLQIKNTHKLINNTQTGGAKEITIDGQIYEKIEQLPEKDEELPEIYIIEPDTNLVPISVKKLGKINYKNMELNYFEDINKKKYIVVCKFNDHQINYSGTILSGGILFKKKVPIDTPCQKFLKELKSLLTYHLANSLYENPVLTPSGHIINKVQDSEGIGYPNIVVQKIIDIYKKHFYNYNEPISDEMCTNFLRDLLDKDKKIFYCNITKELLVDPVTTKIGITYSKKALDEWISKNSTDPFSREPIEKPYYYPNYLVENIIESLQKNNLLS
jgi:hypothetical protein